MSGFSLGHRICASTKHHGGRGGIFSLIKYTQFSRSDSFQNIFKSLIKDTVIWLARYSKQGLEHFPINRSAVISSSLLPWQLLTSSQGREWIVGERRLKHSLVIKEQPKWNQRLNGKCDLWGREEVDWDGQVGQQPWVTNKMTVY